MTNLDFAAIVVAIVLGSAFLSWAVIRGWFN